jgi:hypothetical protein
LFKHVPGMTQPFCRHCCAVFGYRPLSVAGGSVPAVLTRSAALSSSSCDGHSSNTHTSTLRTFHFRRLFFLPRDFTNHAITVTFISTAIDARLSLYYFSRRVLPIQSVVGFLSLSYVFPRSLITCLSRSVFEPTCIVQCHLTSLAGAAESPNAVTIIGSSLLSPKSWPMTSIMMTPASKTRNPRYQTTFVIYLRGTAVNNNSV